METVELVLAAVVVPGTALAVRSWHDARLRRSCLERLFARPEGANREAAQPEAKPFPPRHRVAPAVAGIAVALASFEFFDLPPPFAVSAGLMTAVLGYLIESIWSGRKLAVIETQLADAIDLLVGSLRAGAALLRALEAATRETRRPLKDHLDEVVGRIRLGDDPQKAVLDLANRVPLETFRLFTITLAVQWDTGGSIASAMSLVGKAIRDRIELSRRVRSQAVEAKASVVGVLAISYGVALVMWRANPEALESFLTSSIGTYITSATIALQAIGIAWISRMSRIRY